MILVVVLKKTVIGVTVLLHKSQDFRSIRVLIVSTVSFIWSSREVTGWLR